VDRDSLPPEEFDRLDHLDEGVADDFGAAMAGLHASHGLRVLGGGGTNHRHIRALARHLGAGVSN
jgi:methionine synthase I (cobalamin-dependent)